MNESELTEQEIKALYPEFAEWIHKVKGYSTAGDVYLILLWYEWLRGRIEE